MTNGLVKIGFALSLLLLGCASSGASTGDGRTDPTTRRGESLPPTCSEADALRPTVEAYFAAFNRHDAEAVGAFYAEDAVMEDPAYDAPVKGRRRIVEHLCKLMTDVPDIRDEMRGMVTGPDKVAVEFVATGMPAPGAPRFSVAIATVFELRDGKIIRDATYYDRTEE